MKQAIMTKEKRFVDHLGRHTILHGVNLVCKDKSHNYIGDFSEQDFKNLKKWGFNVIRLGIIWDGLEPEPGIYDDDYLKKIDRFIKFANKYSIYVYLDMHQDLYSYKYADGAPEWATLTDGQPHTTYTDLWSDAYLTSPAIQRAFDNFWNNTEAEDGLGLQDHYANAWRHVAKRYRDSPTVIGYDIMNEPFMGSGANELVYALLKSYGNQMSQRGLMKEIQMDQLMNMWMDPYAKDDAIKMLEDNQIYAEVLKGAEHISQKFEETYLNPFYNKVLAKIREVDDHKIIFFEPNYFCNIGIKTGLKPLSDAQGLIDGVQCYAPHGYDLLVDTEIYGNASNERVKFIFSQHNEMHRYLNIPMLIGEWGAFPDSESIIDHGYYTTRLFEEFLCSDTYWIFSKEIEKTACFTFLNRAYPMKVCGRIIKYHHDFERQIFTCTYRE